jgi:hypothetical protein
MKKEIQTEPPLNTEKLYDIIMNNKKSGFEKALIMLKSFSSGLNIKKYFEHYLKKNN